MKPSMKNTSRIFNLVNLYYVIAFIGLIVTWKYNLQYMSEGGNFFSEQLITDLSANAVTTSFAVDLTIVNIAFIVFVFASSKKYHIKYPLLYIILGTIVALAFAFPFYLAVLTKAQNRLRSDV
ncbi:DUF2834 domain-containing protein [Capnocytophaga catalasegens]|uniref:DUF2834 domain-containing protein n=1 Tax=Capnocytophaga catalasegens TaxID=1004260 RepID=A0AAV5ASD8_9FLAO|nr:DUF2834 domain-containing protein [Capnocytophaga catalasegens]GIZ15602.1 hypothetical protein RCZ03_16020 [Capnocytophaga catalasegens]GJM50201.1 hypothetical protein RCZ15_11750 [Capnocytophaga catalasegens]GJM52036.1 hypothetical protein RCZ16_03540 [Capnocytophaga catalasegens]